MAIELVTKYLPYVDELFTTESKKSLLTNNDFDWTGAHTVKTYKIGTTTMTDYDRAGTGSGAAGSRYGTIGNLSASTQPHVITKDRSFTFVIDKLDSDETGKALEAASALARQLREVVVPEVDAYVYVDILKRSDIADEKILGYLDILEVKAQRLKTLTEDVVEASKVSSGNITLEYMDIDFREMVQQTEGEMAEKFAARNLSVVLNLPEEAAVIHVDGRRMWRVLENIFGNAAKYAMPGTRVYADLSVSESEVKFSLKNVSEQQLNISADELTERFIRGDISRSTEGSGLGLSIAKSLTEMQGGVFELYLDGDLFKVDIRFPRIKPM